MLRDKKFVWLVFVCFLVGILEFLSLGGIHLPRIIEISSDLSDYFSGRT